MRKAFTLAEVLITLGIIGVVAAMTLPAIIQKQQKLVAAKRLSQTYSQIYYAINMSQSKFGDMKNWSVGDNYGTSFDPENPDTSANESIMIKDFAETYLKPYLKYTGTPDIKTLKDAGYNVYQSKDGRAYMNENTTYYIIELVNGVTLFIGYNQGTTIFTLPVIFVDINGKTKPNILGRDFFLFSLDAVSTMKVLPYGQTLDRTTLLERCAKHNDGNVYDNFACTALIMSDGWEIKKDYPW